MARPKLPASVTLDLSLDEEGDVPRMRRAVARKLRVDVESLPELVLLRRAIDARAGRVRFHVELGLGSARENQAAKRPPQEVRSPERVVIVGDGPAGLFCAYELARQGIRCTVLDRGKSVQPRRRDLKGLNQEGHVDGDSNYCFGEGGAGTYSDGKLYTRSDKRGDIRDVIDILALHGAPEAIRVDARPHIGSNKLPKVVSAMRASLEAVGVEFRFGARVDALLTRDEGRRRRLAALRLASGEEVAAEAFVIATGHSARDVFSMLDEAGARLEAKSFALGVRIEHPQPLINRIQYGAFAEHPKLKSASYRLAAHPSGQSVFSFCMCPGGWVVPASTEAGALVVNGMSLSKRNSPFANSGMVVAVEIETLARHGFKGPFAGIEVQRRIEEAAFAAGGGALRAPATRATDFVAKRASSQVSATSYIPGLQASDIAQVLDSAGPDFSTPLREALQEFGRRMRGYLSEEAMLIGVETRTSCPLRVPRDPQSLESSDIADLYPCGEGAGYAGGIVSAALDGMAVAKSIATRFAAQSAR